MLHRRISLFKTIATDNANLVRATAQDSWNGVNLAQREERIIHDYLQGVNGAGVAYLNQHLPAVFLNFGFELKFAGVFCHGHPRVIPCQGQIGLTYRGFAPIGGQCELGDLHVVFVLLDNSKNLRDQRSLLFQAKMKRHSTGRQISHANQADLYEKADGYRYATNLPGDRWWPKHRDRERALHYLFCGSPDVETSSACAPAPMSFGELVFRFLLDAEGLYFKKPTGGWPGWWRINWDLIRLIGGLPYRGQPRGRDLVDVLTNFNDFADAREHFLEMPDGGISTLFVIVKDRELWPDKEPIKHTH